MQDAAATKWTIDVGEAEFESDVLERSQTTPVIVDFWAEWCGPCKQLGPLLEKTVAARKGEVILAKVNVDEAQQLAGYFRIESIPAVLAFKDGQAVNGFVGLSNEEDLNEFINSLTGPAKVEPLDEALALEESNPEAAEAIYVSELAKDENNPRGRLGMARLALSRDQIDRAVEMLGTIPDAGEHGAEAVKLRRTIEMKKNAASAGDEGELQQRIAADPENAQLRLELGNALATKSLYPAALATLLHAASLDAELGRGPVRELMVKIFEIVGVRSELADEYRDKLRGMLY